MNMNKIHRISKYPRRADKSAMCTINRHLRFPQDPAITYSGAGTERAWGVLQDARTTRSAANWRRIGSLCLTGGRKALGLNEPGNCPLPGGRSDASRDKDN